MKYNTILEPIPSPVPSEGGVEMEQPIRVMCVDGLVRTMEVEEYLKAVVPSEVYPSWPEPVLDAQAICARSYAVAKVEHSKHHYQGYDVCSKQCCQVYKSLSKHPSTTAAVDRTKGIVGIEKGVVMPMFYSACCGGSTLDHWAPSYLRIVGCPCGPHKEVNGHRQGMCQWGAYYCVKDWNFETWKQILDHYFDLEYRYDYGHGELVFPFGDDEPTNELQQLRQRVDDLELTLGRIFSRFDGLKNEVDSLDCVLANVIKRLDILTDYHNIQHVRLTSVVEWINGFSL